MTEYRKRSISILHIPSADVNPDGTLGPNTVAKLEWVKENWPKRQKSLVTGGREYYWDKIVVTGGQTIPQLSSWVGNLIVSQTIKILTKTTRPLVPGQITVADAYDTHQDVSNCFLILMKMWNVQRYHIKCITTVAYPLHGVRFGLTYCIQHGFFRFKIAHINNPSATRKDVVRELLALVFLHLVPIPSYINPLVLRNRFVRRNNGRPFH
jgi:hypothetical protein